MNIKSEKDFYDALHEEIAQQFDADYYVWGEEFVHKKLIVYSGKIKNIRNYAELKKTIERCGLFVLDFRKEEFLRCVSVLMDIATGDIYISEDLFNSVWQQLRESIKIGILLAKEAGEEISIEKPEDVVDLSKVQSEKGNVEIKNFKIQKKRKELTDEEKTRIGKRQSLLDNPKMNYYFSSQGGCVHDKECELVKNIAAEHFCAAEEYPKGRNMCPKCRRKMLFRKACAPSTKQIPLCDRYFKNQRISNDMAYHFIYEAGLRFHPDSLSEMVVEGKEDTWRIRGTLGTGLELWHNNYVKTSDTERYITDGFHNQGVSRKHIIQILRYIEGYTWEKHLQGETMKAQMGEKKTQQFEDSILEEIGEHKKNMRNRNVILGWVRKIVGLISEFIQK